MDAKELVYEIAKKLANAERELALVKAELHYAVADIPHTCQFCMSTRCPTIANDCEGCESGSNWHWYGAIEV